jgi:hypothetical protein
MNPTVSGPLKIPPGCRSSHSPRPAPGARSVPCPYCGITNGVRQTSDTGRIQAWSCDRCDTDWAFTVPDLHTAALADLDAVAQEIRRLRWTWRQIIALADDAPQLADEQLRDRLLALAESCTGEPSRGAATGICWCRSSPTCR